MASLLVFVISLLGVSLCSAQTPLRFVELGETSGVSTENVPRADDGTSGPILINFNLPLGNTSDPRTAYVSINGIISFGHPYDYCCPSEFPVVSAPPFVAPFWSDGDTRLSGMIRYEVHKENQGESSTLLDSINAFINNASSARRIPSRSSDYEARWALVADWSDIHPFPHGFGIHDDTTDPTNTFQAIVVTDCYTAYTIFIHGCNLLNWSGQVFPARVGYSTPDGDSRNYYEKYYYYYDYYYYYYKDYKYSFSGGNAATSLNATACSEDEGVFNIVYQIGTRQGNCEVLKGTYLDYLIEHHFDLVRGQDD